MKSTKNQRNDENLKKLKSFIFYKSKNQYNENECRCQEKTRMILTRMYIWVQCKERRNIKTFLIFESPSCCTKRLFLAITTKIQTKN